MVERNVVLPDVEVRTTLVVMVTVAGRRATVRVMAVVAQEVVSVDAGKICVTVRSRTLVVATKEVGLINRDITIKRDVDFCKTYLQQLGCSYIL
jgi:hypothetical protein